VTRKLRKSATKACSLRRALAHEDRLLLLCQLAHEEHSVSELEELLDIRQPSLSQQLGVLRKQGLVSTRRDGKRIYYSVADAGVMQVDLTQGDQVERRTLPVLEGPGIWPDLVFGTSAGSLVAALWPSGKSGVELGSLAESMDESALTDWMYPGRGLLRGEGLARYVREHTDGRQIEAMKIPLGIVATDLASGEAILFQRGDPGVAVRASSAVPAVFQPVRIGTREYVDGGLVAPVPVQFARQMGADQGHRHRIDEALRTEVDSGGHGGLRVVGCACRGARSRLG